MMNAVRRVGRNRPGAGKDQKQEKEGEASQGLILRYAGIDN